MGREHNCFVNPYCSHVLSDNLYLIRCTIITSFIMQSIASSYVTARMHWCDKVRYRNNGFLELVCVCGTDAAMPCTCTYCVRVRVWARRTSRACTALSLRTFDRLDCMRCKCKDQFEISCI